MATITTSNTTTQLLIRSTGTDFYTALKLPANQVTMDNSFFQEKSVDAVMPQIYVDECDQVLSPDVLGFCTWEITNDLENGIILTDKSMVLTVRNSSGITVLPAVNLVSYVGDTDTTYSLQIYIKSSEDIPAGTYSAVIQL